MLRAAEERVRRRVFDFKAKVPSWTDETLRLGPDDGVVVELAPGAPESALDELLSRIHAAPESCVHVVPLRALDAPGSETEGEHAEGAEPKSHAESAESAEFAESIPPQWEKEVPFSTK